MLKRLSILILTVLMVVPAVAQPKESCECAFGPKKGQWEVSLTLGQGQFFNDASGLYYLLPAEDGTAIGIGSNAETLEMVDGQGNAYTSADLATYVLNVGSLNANTICNIAGINAKYFFNEHWALSFGGAYSMNLQPSKDYEEGTSVDITNASAADGSFDPSYVENNVGIDGIYSQKAILGVSTHSGIANLGVDYYFHIKRAPRVNPFLGLYGQFKIARIGSYYPYTGQTVESDLNVVDAEATDLKYASAEEFRSNRAGQALGFVAAMNFGVDFSATENLILGIQVAPVAYQYSLIHLQVMGQNPYYAYNHNIRAFAYPQLRIGFRF